MSTGAQARAGRAGRPPALPAQTGARDEAAEAIRSLIDHITLTPRSRRGEIAATLHGDLGTILEWAAIDTNAKSFDCSLVQVVRQSILPSLPFRR
jgi:hypothetical protein